VITRLGLALLGAYVALIGAVVHRHRVELMGVDWPWGLALALGATAAVAVAAGHVRRVRIGETWFALGWTLMILGQSAAPTDSYLVANDWLGWVFSLLGMGSLGAVIVRNSRLER
jgi:hypothetical protein